jgi:murein DD-endopeptidase MepM/ murein hydrolase activator NlpD
MRCRMLGGVALRCAVGVLTTCLLLLRAAPSFAQGPGAGGPADRWVWPLAGAQLVSRPFDPPRTRYGPGHRGADLPGAAGAVVRAAGAGRVAYAGLLAGRGVVVVVHGELRTTYEPVTSTVRVGQQLAAGQALGRLAPGHGGCPGVCLHWGLLRGDVYLDPVHLVRRGPSRLLPLPGAGVPAAAELPGQPAALRAPAAPPEPAGEPAFSLRAAQARWGATALLALLGGLALLIRPGRRPPDGPAAVAAGRPAPEAERRGRVDEPVDLEHERLRRRA